jgi:hypothetical protein
MWLINVNVWNHTLKHQIPTCTCKEMFSMLPTGCPEDVVLFANQLEVRVELHHTRRWLLKYEGDLQHAAYYHDDDAATHHLIPWIAPVVGTAFAPTLHNKGCDAFFASR